MTMMIMSSGKPREGNILLTPGEFPEFPQVVHWIIEIGSGRGQGEGVHF
jgi:hypothetical protein